MPTEETLTKLAETIQTSQRKNALLREIGLLKQKLSTWTVANDQPTNQNEPHGQKTYPILQQVVTALYPNLSTPVDQELLARLLDMVDKLPEVTMETPVDCPDIGRWARANIQSQALVTLRTSSITPIAGLTVAYAGRYRDMSLNKIIKDKVYV